MSILKPLLSLADTPGMPEAIAAVAAATRGKVCGVCGLGQFGHGPESKWLGYATHDFAAIPADSAMLRNANRLTSEAYRLRRVMRESDR